MDTIVIKALENTRLHKEVRSDAINEIGSMFDSTTKDVLRGLSFEDERRLLPPIIGVSITDPTFNEKVRLFWMNISIIVNSESGCVLNITTTEDGKKEPYPVAPQDWVKYQYVKKLIERGVKVAINEESARANDKIYEYYIVDEGANRKLSQVNLQARKQAQKIYLDLTYDNLPEQMLKARWILEMMKEHMIVLKAKDIQALSAMDIHLLLEEAANKYPKEFAEIANDPKLEIRGFISLAVDKGVLTKNGNAIYNIDNLLGKDMDIAINYLSADANSDEFGKLKYQLDSALKIKK